MITVVVHITIDTPFTHHGSYFIWSTDPIPVGKVEFAPIPTPSYSYTLLVLFFTPTLSPQGHPVSGHFIVTPSIHTIYVDKKIF